MENKQTLTGSPQEFTCWFLVSREQKCFQLFVVVYRVAAAVAAAACSHRLMFLSLL